MKYSRSGATEAPEETSPMFLRTILEVTRVLSSQGLQHGVREVPCVEFVGQLKLIPGRLGPVRSGELGDMQMQHGFCRLL
jgi:hypothetical protein